MSSEDVNLRYDHLKNVFVDQKLYFYIHDTMYFIVTVYMCAVKLSRPSYSNSS